MKNEVYEILIVEDNPAQVEQLKNILEQQGYIVALVNNGKEALSYLSNRKPQIVISDIVMPEMDGYELCRLIKSNEKQKNISVILLTTLSDPADIIKALICGVDNLIVVPYKEKYLLSLIEYIKVNKELRKCGQSQLGVEVYFAGQQHFITSDRLQILDLLFFTYETTMQKNRELEKTKENLNQLNKQLEENVKERIAALTVNIAELQRTEEKLRKLHRVYEVTSSINETIVRIHDRQSLFDNVCRIAVEEGRFRMAWIGLIDENSKRIKTTANYGFAGNYFKKLDIKLDNKRNASNPAVIAIDTMEYCVCNDIETDIRMKPWQEIALRNEYRSLCAFPIIVFGKPFGILILYSDQRFFFDEEEIRLLDEMALDLSFCIETIINEEQHRIAEKETIRAKEKAEEANRLKNSFLSMISHEIRTPLNAIVGHIYFLKDLLYKSADNDVRLSFNAIEICSKRLLYLITELIDTSRIEAGEFPIIKKTILLNDEIKSVYKQLKLMADEKNIGVNLDLPESPVIVKGDQYCLRGVLINLLGNAIKFSKKGKIEIRVCKDERWGICSIKDEGVGMSKEYQKHLFETFSQEDLGYSKSFEGAGLGLALTKKYIELMNGEIDIKSQKEIGTTATFKIPLNNVQQ